MGAGKVLLRSEQNRWVLSLWQVFGAQPFSQGALVAPWRFPDSPALGDPFLQTEAFLFRESLGALGSAPGGLALTLSSWGLCRDEAKQAPRRSSLQSMLPPCPVRPALQPRAPESLWAVQ